MPESGHGSDACGSKWHAPPCSESAAQKRSFRPQRRGLSVRQLSLVFQNWRVFYKGRIWSYRSKIDKIWSCRSQIEIKSDPVVPNSKKLILSFQVQKSLYFWGGLGSGVWGLGTIRTGDQACHLPYDSCSPRPPNLFVHRGSRIHRT
jgi:hypothetical protein